MIIKEGTVVSIDYTLTLDSQEVVDKSDPGEPLSFIVGSGQIIPGLEDALEGKKVGDELTAKIAPEDGYGESREELINEIPRKNFPDMELEAGMTFQAEGPHGPISFTVASVAEETIMADFNHPLAGKTLNFDVKVVEAREATPEEIESLNSSQESHCGDGSHGCSGCGHH